MQKQIINSLFFLFLYGSTFAQPSNNTCGNAQSITLPTPSQTNCVNGTTVGATATFGNSFWICQGNGQDVWYTFSTGSDVSFSVDFIRGTIGNGVEIDFFSQCPPGGYIGFVGCFNTNFTFTMTLQPNTTYYMLVYNGKSGNNAGQGTFQFCITNTQITLPVELISFEVTPTPQSNLLLWKTASEYNSDYYSVEYSIDGINFNALTYIKAVGYSNLHQEYSFSDDTNLYGIIYYRLLQYDLDGKYKIYGPISVYNSLNGKKIIKIVNSLGQVVDENSKGLLFEVYEDGTTKKIIR